AFDTLSDDTGGLQRVERHVAVDPGELMHAYRVPRGRHRGTEPDLRQATLQRHLAALEADLVIAARSRVLTLRASARGLALARARTAADARRRLAAAVGRFQRVQPHVKPPRPGRDSRPC